jgi:hypothetical protein
MSDADRETLLEAFRSGPARLRKAVEGPPGMPVAAKALDYRPFADAWTVRENIVHLCDAESYIYGRFRKAIAEPGARVDVWDEERWHAVLRYEAVDHLAGLALFQAARLATASLLDQILGEDWSAYHIEHPQRGRMTLEQLMTVFADHDSFHLDLIERDKRLFREASGR